MRETLREFLLEIPGFRALSERGIPTDLIASPTLPGGAAGPAAAAAAKGRPRPPEPASESDAARVRSIPLGSTSESGTRKE